MPEDPAAWLPQLVKEKWDAAVQSLAEDGKTYPVTPRPIAHAESDKAAMRITNVVLIRAYQAGDENRTGYAQGHQVVDTTDTWALQLEVQDNGKQARAISKAAKEIVNRLLELHRKSPHADWDLIETWRWNTPQDYWDYQKRVCTLTLGQYGRLMPEAIADRTRAP